MLASQFFGLLLNFLLYIYTFTNLIIAIEKDQYESHLPFKILSESDIDSFIAGFTIITFVCRHMDRTGKGRDMLCTDQEKGNTGIEVQS